MGVDMTDEALARMCLTAREIVRNEFAAARARLGLEPRPWEYVGHHMRARGWDR